MTEPLTRPSALRTGLIDILRATRDVEGGVLAGLDSAVRDAPAADGGWSPKDVQAHLSAWKRRQTERLAAIREGREEPVVRETDELNAVFHDERAGWTWDQVLADADEATERLIAEIEAASDPALETDRVAGTIMGNGSEHSLVHLPPLAALGGTESRVLELADAVTAVLDRGGWPDRSAAFARYNLACYHALSGNLDVARALLRQSLPEQEELRTLAPEDDDLIALRDEIPALAEPAVAES